MQRLVVRLQRPLRSGYRNISSSNISRILSKGFELNDDWDSRHSALKELNLGGGYEWIAAVQKKFVGGGKASAVDVDAAACLSEESDQLVDVLELIYKLRHSDNAPDLLPSTEYALFRLLLKHNAIPELFKIINDPINYGTFPNYHISALLIDYLLKNGNIAGAAKIATLVMQQEMFDSPLLNLLSLVALTKFVELPAEERIFDDVVQKRDVAIDEDDVNEDDIRTMRFPFLKNHHYDDHFDLVETDALIGKSIEWFSREVNAGDAKLASNLQLLSLIYRDDLEAFEKALVDQSLYGSAAVAISSRIQQLIEKLPAEGREDSDEFKKLTALIAKIEHLKDDKELSAEICEKLRAVQMEGEKELIDDQKLQFSDWVKSRKEFIRMQAERVNLRLRIEEIKVELKQKDEEKEVLFFFENRVNWEDKAAEKSKLYEEFSLNKKDETVTEGEYAKTMFEKAIKNKRKATG